MQNTLLRHMSRKKIEATPEDLLILVLGVLPLNDTEGLALFKKKNLSQRVSKFVDSVLDYLPVEKDPGQEIKEERAVF
jgi:hypothetical protein